LYLEGQDLADGGPTCAGWKGFDVDEYLLSTLSGLQKAEATLVVPSLECSGESHAAVCVWATYAMQISRYSSMPVYPTRYVRTPFVDADTKSIGKPEASSFRAFLLETLDQWAMQTYDQLPLDADLRSTSNAASSFERQLRISVASSSRLGPEVHGSQLYRKAKTVCCLATAGAFCLLILISSNSCVNCIQCIWRARAWRARLDIENRPFSILVRKLLDNLYAK
jgi:hypothetical protein